jgi:hypothetical protein
MKGATHMNRNSLNPAITSSKRSVRRRWAWLAITGLGLAGATLALGRDSAAHTGEPSLFERRCVGTYLVLEEGSGAQTLWTFHADGTLIASSSGESLFDFSGQQGAWRPDGEGAKAVELDFDWDDAGTLQAIGRVDIDVHADDRRCDSISGDFEGRLFAPGDDPLDISDVPALYGDTVSGRRVSVP